MVHRNANRGEDCISAHYAERFQSAWLVAAVKEVLASIEGVLSAPWGAKQALNLL